MQLSFHCFFSVVALIVALMTFSSIDSVNQITSMEGNVFENEAYAVAYSELIEEYCECKDGAAFEDAFVKKLLNQVRNQSNTCKSFADAIQNIIDQIVWAEYIHFGHLKEKTNKDIDQLVNRIRKKQKKFNKLSNGTMYLLEENIKLIELIFSYQAKKSKNDDIQENRNALLNIRGAMIRNPISQIIYYDYLGLHYINCVNQIVTDILEINYNQFILTPEIMKRMKSIKGADMDCFSEKLRILIDCALKAFQAAKKTANDDLFWNGYIEFNLARTELYRILLLDRDDENELRTIMKRALDARNVVVHVFSRISDKEEATFLERMLEDERNYAFVLKCSVDRVLDISLDKNDIKRLDVLAKKESLDRGPSKRTSLIAEALVGE